MPRFCGLMQSVVLAPRKCACMKQLPRVLFIKRMELMCFYTVVLPGLGHCLFFSQGKRPYFDCVPLEIVLTKMKEGEEKMSNVEATERSHFRMHRYSGVVCAAGAQLSFFTNTFKITFKMLCPKDILIFCNSVSCCIFSLSTFLLFPLWLLSSWHVTIASIRLHSL